MPKKKPEADQDPRPLVLPELLEPKSARSLRRVHGRSDQVKRVVTCRFKASITQSFDQPANFRPGDIFGKRASINIHHHAAHSLLCVLNCFHHRVENGLRLKCAGMNFAHQRLSMDSVSAWELENHCCP